MKKWLMAAGLAVLAACNAPPTNSNAIPGSYRLLEIDGQPLAGSATAKIATNGAISGQGPCNRFFGSSRAALPALDYSAIATTRRACVIEGGEGQFLTALAAVREASVQGDRLGCGGRA